MITGRNESAAKANVKFVYYLKQIVLRREKIFFKPAYVAYKGTSNKNGEESIYYNIIPVGSNLHIKRKIPFTSK